MVINSVFKEKRGESELSSIFISNERSKGVFVSLYKFQIMWQNHNLEVTHGNPLDIKIL